MRSEMIKSLLAILFLAMVAACGGEPADTPEISAPQTQAAPLASDDQGAPARERLEASIDVPANDPAIANLPKAVISTTMGDITVALYAEKAPKTVTNFIEYVNGRQYTRTIFHRVIPGFMIQGGGFSSYLEQRKTRAPVRYEGDNGLNNDRGTLAMARTQDPDSASAQWYINLEDNAFLNHGAREPDAPGYTVFGRVISGMNVVDAIATVETSDQIAGNGQPLSNVPVDPVVIDSVVMAQ